MHDENDFICIVSKNDSYKKWESSVILHKRLKTYLEILKIFFKIAVNSNYLIYSNVKSPINKLKVILYKIIKNI